MDIDILGIDLAKRVFQLHGCDRHGHAQVRAKIGRAVPRGNQDENSASIWMRRPAVLERGRA